MSIERGGRLTAADLVTMAGGPFEIELLPRVGARLHRVRAFGHDLLRTPPVLDWQTDDPFVWGAYVMAPWCNRIAALPTRVAGREIRLESRLGDGTALHGEVYDCAWEEAGEEAGTGRRFRVHGGGDGWPWPYEASIGLSIDAATLRIDLALTNLADGPMPAGLGLHPWFALPVEVRLRAEEVYRSNVEIGPKPEPVTAWWDLRELGPMAADLDATWTGLTDLESPTVELHWPVAGLSATLAARSRVAPAPRAGTAAAGTPDLPGGLCVVAASPTGTDGIAIEPQTHAPQGIRRLLNGEPDPMTLLEPGAALRLTIELTVRS